MGKTIKSTKRHEMVARAMARAGSSNLGAVCLELEEVMHEEMQNWPSYQRLGLVSRKGQIFNKLERLKLYTTSDVQLAINEVLTRKKV